MASGKWQVRQMTKLAKISLLIVALGCAAKSELREPVISTGDEVFVAGFAVQVAGVNYDVYVIQTGGGAQIWWVRNEMRLRVDYRRDEKEYCGYPFLKSVTPRELEYELQELIAQLFLKRAEIEF
ncbi:MAG: hypothetical protein ACE5IR_08295 [bacterium]